jgi:hypothetical protein
MKEYEGNHREQRRKIRYYLATDNTLDETED